jgi:hypothetical protein
VSKYIGVCYSNASFKDIGLFTSALLFFDELHIVLPVDTSKDMNTYIREFKVPYQVHLIGVDDESGRVKVAQYKEAIEFALRNRSLVGNCLFYHSHILSDLTNGMIERFRKGSVPKADLYSFVKGTDKEGQIIREFLKLINDPSDEWFVSIASTAYIHATRQDWQLVSEDGAFPVPVFSRSNLRVKQLTSVLAEECFKTVVPECRSIEPGELLEVRHRLAEVLVPYRMVLQKLSGQLRMALQSEVSLMDIKREAKFLAESQIEPAIFELQRKIEKDQTGAILKVFGKVLGWIPVVANVFMTPTPDRIYEALNKVYADVGELSGNLIVNLKREPSLSYLLVAKRLVSGSAPI